MKKIYSILALAAFGLFSNQTIAQGFTTECVDFSKTEENTMSNDSLYPIGSVVLADGSISIIKGEQFSGSGSIFGNDSKEIFFAGTIEIDVSKSQCSTKDLTLGIMMLDSVVVDGTVFKLGFVGDSVMQANNYTLTKSSNGITVNGRFDRVFLGGSTNVLSSVCLVSSDCATTSSAAIADNNTNVFPNPFHDQLNVDLGLNIADVVVYNAVGTPVLSRTGLTGVQELNLQGLALGMYFVQISQEGGKKVTRVVKN